jgi:hypothetical protein
MIVAVAFFFIFIRPDKQEKGDSNCHHFFFISTRPGRQEEAMTTAVATFFISTRPYRQEESDYSCGCLFLHLYKIWQGKR